MSIKEIQESGLIEYYVLGLLSDEEVKMVEGYLVQYPQLQEDYLEIQKAMESYAKAQGIVPKADLEQRIIENIVTNGSKNPVNTVSPQAKEHTTKSKAEEKFDWKSIALPALLAATLFFSWYGYNKGLEYSNLQSEFNTYKEDCETKQSDAVKRQTIYANLSTPNNRTLNLTPTDGYKQANILFHLNEIEKINYIQIKNLPQIASNQAFQLWSLKEGVDPIPLTVFKEGTDLIIPVDFEEGTGTYAITIENEEGATVPTLTRLIGTIGV